MFTTGFTTVISTLELTSALVANHKGATIERYIPVILNGSDGSSLTVEVKIDVERMETSSDLADSTELIRCVTPKGYGVDFLSPPPQQRAANRSLKAFAFLDQRLLTP